MPQIITRVADNTIEVHLKDEDVAIADIIHHELLQDKDVVFAGVVPPHPLIKEVVLKLQSKKEDPITILLDSTKNASRITREILEGLETALQHAKS